MGISSLEGAYWTVRHQRRMTGIAMANIGVLFKKPDARPRGVTILNSASLSDIFLFPMKKRNMIPRALVRVTPLATMKRMATVATPTFEKPTSESWGETHWKATRTPRVIAKSTWVGSRLMVKHPTRMVTAARENQPFQPSPSNAVAREPSSAYPTPNNPSTKNRTHLFLAKARKACNISGKLSALGSWVASSSVWLAGGGATLDVCVATEPSRSPLVSMPASS
eukprot:scaffold840_cov344-Pavlova_lutheri.AAC.138